MAETIEASQRLRARLQAGDITEAQYDAQTAELVAETADGVRWRLCPHTLTWRWWDGQSWAAPGEGYLQRGPKSEMTFEKAELARKLAQTGLEAGQLTAEQFAEQIKGLRVQDQQGRWWEMGRETATWYCWLAGEWQSLEAMAARAEVQERVVPTSPLLVPLRVGERRLDAHVDASVLCATCARLEDGLSCAAFPGGIPEAILQGRWDHRLPYRGDGGQRYRYLHAED